MCIRDRSLGIGARDHQQQTGISTSRNSQCAIRNPLKARQCCSPPRAALRPAEDAKAMQAF
eukprot:12440496-Alexandrium_andersonii.AAC.1